MEPLLNVPDPVREVLAAGVDAAKRAFGDDLRSVVLYGSAAVGQMRATSDVNVMLVLARFEESRANAFREPFRFSCAAVNLKAMFVLEEELDLAAREFAQKFADMQRRHVVLYGEDPLTRITISREALVHRTQQVLLNLSLRLREMYIERSLREEQCAVTLAEATAPLRTAATTMRDLEGKEPLAPKEALYAFVHDLGNSDFVELMPHLSEARERRVLPPGRGADLLFSALELARELHRRSQAL